MKPDYKNWIPRGMLYSLIAGTVLSLVLLFIFGVFGIGVRGKLRIALGVVFGISFVVCAKYTEWCGHAYRSFSYDGERKLSKQIIFSQQRIQPRIKSGVQLLSEQRCKQSPHTERHPETGHFLSLQSHITRVMRRSMSIRAVLHSLGYFFAALNASFTNSAEPTGGMVLITPSGKTKCVQCSYTTTSTSQVCGFSARRFSMR